MRTDNTSTRVTLRCGVLLALLVTSAALVISCAGTGSLRQGDQINVASYPSEIQDAYKVFAVRCSRCHTLARPLSARISDPQHWVRYVARMRRNPSSGINPKDGDIILKFLLYYAKQVAAENDQQGIPASAEPESELPPVQPGVPATLPGTTPSPDIPAEEPMTEPASEPTDGRIP